MPEEKPARKLTQTLNVALKPIENSYNSFKRLIKKINDKAPIVYLEVEHFLKRNLVPIRRKKLGEATKLGEISDSIATSLLKQVSPVDEEEIRKIVKSNKSQSFIEMVSKSFGALGRKDYTDLPKSKKFKRILIANRGEIALRVIRACKELGIKTVLVYTDPDKQSLAVKHADESHNIGEKSNYLDYKRIIAIAKKTEAEAVHPGYGFLAENPAFARLCEKNKIKFIGPSSRAIELLGDKVSAKKISMKVEVPIVEGETKPLKDSKQAKKFAKKIGYPIILKAAAGGGGKGMRVVMKEEEIDDAFKSAQAEAFMAFRDKSIYLEKYIEEPRHIEFQIIADQYGNVIHFGERDCSIQRKHQKLIEEAPSPALDPELRERMGNAAVAICKKAKYEGAGTVEFLLDKHKNFYFIEVNTRIQVEHGVTEMVVGVDLVKEQIKIASGGVLAYRQSDIQIKGYAIECRINAEDPLAGFIPSVGTIRQYLPPGGPGIRLNSNGYSGYRVETHYDSLISLLICYGSTRKEARLRMKRALREYVIDGVQTTIPFHLAVLNNKAFRKGLVTTSFIEQEGILPLVRNYYPSSKPDLTQEQKVIVVSTAVARLKQKKQTSSARLSPWVLASRQEQWEG